MSDIRIPQGMRDLIPEDCWKKEQLKNRIEEVFERYGYAKIETPEIEYYETYRTAFGQLHDEEMYKFFDPSGEAMTLRIDMTVPIARVCATRYLNARPPFKFRYCADVFKVRHTFAGKRSQVTDCGVELIGEDSASDLEVLKCALEVMGSLGVDYQLEIGNSDFFRKACRQLNINDHDMDILADLVDRKALPELNEAAEAMGIKQPEFFEALPLLNGAGALEEAERISFSKELRQEVETLKQLDQQLNALGYGKHLLFDFGKVPHLNYYTGIIFEGYVSGVGVGVLSGGRYDSLLQKFGRDLPACGFSVKLDYLLDAEVNL